MTVACLQIVVEVCCRLAVCRTRLVAVVPVADLDEAVSLVSGYKLNLFVKAWDLRSGIFSIRTTISGSVSGSLAA